MSSAGSSSSKTPVLSALPRQPVRSLRELLRPGARLQIVIITLLLVLAYRVPLTDLVIYRWLHDPNWSHGWLVPLFSLYLLATQRGRLLRARPRSSLTGLALLLAAMFMYFGSMLLLQMGYPQALSIVLAILGVTLLMAGWEVMRIVWFPILFLALAIPLPQGLYVDITGPLRELASDVAAAVLSAIPGLHAETSGVTIDYIYGGKTGRLNVEEACSGMRLMMAFVTLGLAMAYLGQRPLWQRVIMVLACIPIALFCNAIRVTTTGCIHVFEYKSLASGTPHELLGLAMLPIALGLFALVGYVLRNLFVEAAEEP
ncbi:MAG: exosortase/archaeosortase family protein [Planctomycetota bacterium]